jgi:hypothetical protein
VRHFVGFTQNETARPFYISEVGAFAFALGQLVQFPELRIGWLQIAQMATAVQKDQLFTTILVRPGNQAVNFSGGGSTAEPPVWIDPDLSWIEEHANGS